MLHKNELKVVDIGFIVCILLMLTRKLMCDVVFYRVPEELEKR